MATAGEGSIRKRRGKHLLLADGQECARLHSDRIDHRGDTSRPVPAAEASDGVSTAPGSPSSSSAPSSATAIIPSLKHQCLYLGTALRSIRTLRLINCLTQAELRFRIEGSAPVAQA